MDAATWRVRLLGGQIRWAQLGSGKAARKLAVDLGHEAVGNEQVQESNGACVDDHYHQGGHEGDS